MNLKSARMDIRSFIDVCDFFSITWSNVFDMIAIWEAGFDKLLDDKKKGDRGCVRAGH